MNRRTPLASALLALFAVPAVWAQQAAPSNAAPPSTPAAPNQSQPAVQLREITVEGNRDSFNAGTTSVTKLPADLHDVPQSVTVLNKALLQSQGANSLQDALRNVPGITLGGAEGGQIGNNINLNGFSARTDIYLDGFRDRGQYYRDTFALDSVEVLQGPSSMLFGRGSTGGVINQVTKKPSLKQASEASLSATTNGLVRATVDHNQPLSETAALRIAAMGQHGKPSTRDQVENTDYGVAPSLRLGIGTPTQITLSALLQHNRDTPDYGVLALNGRPVPVDRDTYYGFRDDRLEQDIAAFNATIEHKLAPKATIRNQTQYNSVRTDVVATSGAALGTIGPGGFTPLTPTGVSALPLNQLAVRQRSLDRYIHDRSLYNQTELNARFGQGFVKHDVLVGVEIGHDDYDNRSRSRSGSCNGVPLNAGTATGAVACEPLVDPAYVDSPAGAVHRYGNLASASADSIGVYANDTLALGSQFKLVGGLRYDHFKADLANTVNASNTTGNTTPARADQSVDFTSVRVGGIWQPRETQSYYVSYSTSFNPSLEQLTNTTGLTTPLDPEENEAYELGGKWDALNGDVSLNAAIFRINKDNARSQNPDGTYSPTGKVQVDGFRAGASGRIAKTWSVFAGYSYLDAKIVDAIAANTRDRVPANTPRHSATLWTTYEFLPHWEVGGGPVYQSSRYLNNTNTVEAGAYVRWDGTLAYRQRAYDVRLNVFNITDRYYYDSLVPSDGGRAIPGTGRTAMLTLSYRM